MISPENPPVENTSPFPRGSAPAVAWFQLSPWPEKFPGVECNKHVKHMDLSMEKQDLVMKHEVKQLGKTDSMKTGFVWIYLSKKRELS